MILRTGRTAAAAAQQLHTLLGQLQTPRNQRDEAIIADSYREPPVAMSAKINAYLDWAQTAEAQMRNQFADTDLSDGLFGERYWHIAGYTTRSRGQTSPALTLCGSFSPCQSSTRLKRRSRVKTSDSRSELA